MPLADLQIDRSQIQEIEKLPGYGGVLYLSALAFNQALRSLVGDYLEKQPAAFEHWKNIAAILFKEAQIGTGTVERESIESVANGMRTYILQILAQIKQSRELPAEGYLLERIFQLDLNRIADIVLGKE